MFGKPNGYDMTWTIHAAPSQAGRLAIVTGANIGLGYDTALALAEAVSPAT